MDTDPNPFRHSPDEERSDSPTEATDDEGARDLMSEQDDVPDDTESPMSEDDDEEGG